MEIHPNIDQFFRIEAETAKVIMNGQETQVNADDVFIVPGGQIITSSVHRLPMR